MCLLLRVDAGPALSLADTANMSLLDDTEPPFTPVAADRSNSHEDGIAVSGRAPDTDVEKKTSPETAPGKSTAKPSTPATTSHIPRRREKPINSPAAPPSSYTPVQRGARRGSDPSSTPNQTVRFRPSIILRLLLIHATANDETRGSVLFCIVKPFLRKRKQRHRSSETTTNIYLLTTKHEPFTSYRFFSPHRAEKLNFHDPPLGSIPRFSAHGPRITRPSGAR